MSRNTFATIDTPALSRNLERVRTIVGGARIMAVIKADAYGHGLGQCVPALAKADLLAVATLDEASAVRAIDARAAILLLEGITSRGELDEVRRLDLELVFHHSAQLDWIETGSGLIGPRVWLKIDTGMHRLGFSIAEADSAYRRLVQRAGVKEVVVMTHLACADRPDHPLNQRQIEAFDAKAERLPGPRCLANSAALLGIPSSRRDWVRAGLLLYGASPLCGEHGDPGRDQGVRKAGFEPVMTLESRLIAINRVAAGETIGYGARFRAARDMHIGVAAIGYGDGYPRNMPDGTPVLVNGRVQALAGRVSMDMITIDLEGQSDARVGDPVVLWGRGLPVESIANAAGTIPYELLCRVTRRVHYR
ncbi:MAG: alanine racemase [Wenzhouxiangellaceae bacterium]